MRDSPSEETEKITPRDPEGGHKTNGAVTFDLGAAVDQRDVTQEGRGQVVEGATPDGSKTRTIKEKLKRESP